MEKGKNTLSTILYWLHIEMIVFLLNIFLLVFC
jgi:hypothetical protein